MLEICRTENAADGNMFIFELSLTQKDACLIKGFDLHHSRCASVAHPKRRAASRRVEGDLIGSGQLMGAGAFAFEEIYFFQDSKCNILRHPRDLQPPESLAS